MADTERRCAIPDDIRECLAWLRAQNFAYLTHDEADSFPTWMDDCEADQAAVWQLLDYLGVL